MEQRSKGLPMNKLIQPLTFQPKIKIPHVIKSCTPNKMFGYHTVSGAVMNFFKSMATSETKPQNIQ